MTKPINHFLEVYAPKAKDEQKFVDKHVVAKHKDRNGNGDDVFNAKNIKTIKRDKEGHGYDQGTDEKVYEDFEESYQELQTLKTRISRNKRKLKELPALHPDGKKLAIQIQRDEKRHRELFNNQFKEEAEEPLDEISVQSHYNYLRAAHKEGQGLSYTGRDHKGDYHFESKESIIDRALSNFVPEIFEKEQLSDEERLIGLLDSTLSESNIHRLLALFESLSEDNRIKMLMLAEDQDGINELLDFAISLKEVATEVDLEDHEPRKVSGVYGVKSKRFERRFKNQSHQDKFFDHPDREGQYEIHYVQKDN